MPDPQQPVTLKEKIYGIVEDIQKKRKSIRCPHCGRYIDEDTAQEMIKKIGRFRDSTPSP